MLEADVAKEFLAHVVTQARAKALISDEHFTVGGTLLEAWAGAKSFQPKDKKQPPPDDPGNPTVNFRGERRSNETHASQTDPEALLARKGEGKESKSSYCGNLLVENRNGLIVDAEVFQANGTAERGAALGDAGETSRRAASDRRRGQRVRHAGLCARVPEPVGHAACGAKPRATGRQRDS